MNRLKHYKKNFLIALKIALGSSLAIYLAQQLNLDNSASAGTITLLTLMTTKWETLKLSGFRILTFMLTALIAWIVFMHIQIIWVAYGIFIFIIVFFAYSFGLVATISVNSVIGAHLLITHDFSLESLDNEFLLVVIGVMIAILLNLFNDNYSHKKEIIKNMRYTEEKLQMILSQIADYLLNPETSFHVWDEIIALEKKILEFQKEAYEYQDNTFYSHPEYYINYFEMRQNQTQMLHNLHYEIKRMRGIPIEAKIVAEYLIYLKDYVVEKNIPQKQIERLQDIFIEIKKFPLPTTQQEFEDQALLYHVLMDIEEFLVFKVRFIRELDEIHLKKYWNQ